MSDPDDPDYDPRAFIQANRWTYARSVPAHQHWYLPAQLATDFAEFQKMCTWVNRTGTPATFAGDGKRHRYKYATVDDYTYWVSRSPWGSSLLLNRRRADGRWVGPEQMSLGL